MEVAHLVHHEDVVNACFEENELRALPGDVVLPQLKSKG